MYLLQASQVTEEVWIENLPSRSLKYLPVYPLLRALETKKDFLEDMLYLGFKERQKIYTSRVEGVGILSAASFVQIAFLF